MSMSTELFQPFLITKPNILTLQTTKCIIKLCVLTTSLFNQGCTIKGQWFLGGMLGYLSIIFEGYTQKPS